MSNSNSLKFTVSEGKRFILFICVTLLCYIVASVIIALIARGELTAPRMRIATLVQDILIFITPALITALIITRRPADFLQISTFPKISVILLTFLIILVMVPAMNQLVTWNESFKLPASMSGLEEIFRNLENEAQKFTAVLINGSSTGALIMAILIVGILTGFSEEIFFRGSLQRLFSTGGMGVHTAIWITAFIFSAVHMQIYGFIPRLLLGAFFGYLTWWSRSVWLAVIAHATNNSMVVIATHIQQKTGVDLNTIGAYSSASDKFAFWSSIVLTTVGLMFLYKQCSIKGRQVKG